MAGEGTCRQSTRPTVSDGAADAAAQPGKKSATADPLDAASAGLTAAAAAARAQARSKRKGRMHEHSRRSPGVLPAGRTPTVTESGQGSAEVELAVALFDG